MQYLYAFFADAVIMPLTNETQGRFTNKKASHLCVVVKVSSCSAGVYYMFFESILKNADTHANGVVDIAQDPLIQKVGVQCTRATMHQLLK